MSKQAPTAGNRDRRMSLVRNTGRLIAQDDSSAGSSEPIEYALLSWRELYDSSIISADRHHSTAGEWVVQGTPGFYSVRVTSHPFYRLPQHLILSFDCYGDTKEYGFGSSRGPRIEEIATDFCVLLSAFAREPIVPAGIRRRGNKPVTDTPQYSPPRLPDAPTAPEPVGIYSPDLLDVVRGLPKVATETSNAVVAAAKFYHLGLSAVGFDPSLAYVSMVSAVECLAADRYRNEAVDFEQVQKFAGLRQLLAEVARYPDGERIVRRIKEELLSREHFSRQRFADFILEHLTEDAWLPDPMHRTEAVVQPKNREELPAYVRRAYDARSQYVHGGLPFPAYVDMGLRETVTVDAMFQTMEILSGKTRKSFHVPGFVWFGRVVHMVLLEYMFRKVAPQLHDRDERQRQERLHWLEVLSGLRPDEQASLRQLARWTAQFVGTAMIGPMAPNRDWAVGDDTARVLQKAGLIDTSDPGRNGTSHISNRAVGRVIGEWVFGASDNPFRGAGAQILPP